MITPCTDHQELTVREFADCEQVSPRSIYEWVRKGWIPSRRTPSGRIRIPAPPASPNRHGREYLVSRFAALERVRPQQVYHWVYKGAVTFRRTQSGRIRIIDRREHPRQNVGSL